MGAEVHSFFQGMASGNPRELDMKTIPSSQTELFKNFFKQAMPRFFQKAGLDKLRNIAFPMTETALRERLNATSKSKTKEPEI